MHPNSKSTFLICILTLFSFGSCEKEVTFAFELDYLLNTQWGIPHIIESAHGTTPVLSAPTIFYPDGTMRYGLGNFDTWSIRSSRTILLDRSQELWLIMDLSPTHMEVEKSRFPTGEFLLRCIYFAL